MELDKEIGWMGTDIARITEKVFLWLMEQPIGTEISLREAFDNVYREEGYEWVQHQKKAG